MDRDDRVRQKNASVPAPASVTRGRRILLALLVAQLALWAAARLCFGFTSLRWEAVGLAVVAVYYGCWYACWRGSEWGYRFLVAISVMGVVSVLLHPYGLSGYTGWTGAVLDLLVASALLLSSSVKSFLAYQQAGSG